MGPFPPSAPGDFSGHPCGGLEARGRWSAQPVTLDLQGLLDPSNRGNCLGQWTGLTLYRWIDRSIDSDWIDRFYRAIIYVII